MKDRLAFGAILLLGLVWGYTWVVIKLATADASPFVLVAMRQAFSAAALFAVVALLRRPLRAPPLGWTLLIGLFQVTLMTSLQTLALATGGAGKVTVLVYTFPFFIVLLSAPLLHEPITAQRALVTAVAAVGLGFVLYPLDLTHAPLSVIFALLAALSWSFGAIFIKRFRAKHHVDLLAFTAWQMLFGAIPLSLVALLVPGSYVHATPAFVLAMAYIVVFGSALAFWLWFFLLERLSAASAGIASLLVPVVGVLAAWLQLHEVPSPTETIGIVLIVVALALNGVRLPVRPTRVPSAG